MNIPKKVKVGGTTYKVKNADVISNDPGLIGQCDFENATIELLKRHKRQAKELTFLHELLHAIFYHCNLEHDEHKIELLAQALHMVIIDNPDLFSN